MPKIEFINARVIEFTAHREAMFRTVDGNAAGRRFATNSQTQQLIWPRRRTRAQVAVQHLCTAHANSGYIMAAGVLLHLAWHWNWIRSVKKIFAKKS